MNYEQANAVLGVKDMKRIGNNTWLRRKDENTIAVQLHRTDVVLIHKDGTFTLDSGGWRTVTTKARINKYSPARVYANKGDWRIADHSMFHDGIRVDSQGEVIG